MKSAKVFVGVVFAVLLCGSAAAETVDFESAPLDSSGLFFDTNFVAGSVTITRLSGPTVILGPPTATPGGTKALVGYKVSSGGTDYGLEGNQWSATFATTVNGVSIDLGDLGADADNIFLAAFNASNVQIGIVSQLIPSGFSGLVTLNLAVSDIKSIKFGLSSGDGIFADNLVVNPVPIPGMLPVFAAVVGLLGLIARRRSRQKRQLNIPDHMSSVAA